VPPPSQHCEDALDSRADELVARATAKDPARRHPDVQSFMYELRALMGMLGMDQASRRRALAPEAARERREVDHRIKAAAEIFSAVPLPMASCDPRTGRVRAANTAFLEFVGAAGDAGGLELRDTALPEVYPTLFDDLEEVASRRRPIKRVIYLHEGGDRVIEAAVVLSRLQGFEDFVRQRRNVFTRLHEGLKDRAEIGKSIEFHAEGVSYYRFLLQFVEPAFSFGDNAGLFRRLINERGIVAEKPIELWTKPGDFAGADRLYRNVVSLPCYPSLDARAIETIVRGAEDTLADMARMA